MRRMEVRCCCTPNKLLGTLPVTDRVFNGNEQSMEFPLMGVPSQGLPYSRITLDVAEWVESRIIGPLGDLLVQLPMDYGLSRSGVALKHEGVTLETLRRIPGFIEAN